MSLVIYKVLVKISEVENDAKLSKFQMAVISQVSVSQCAVSLFKSIQDILAKQPHVLCKEDRGCSPYTE